MALPSDYEWIEVESFRPGQTSGLHGKVHVRPVAGGPYPTTLHVECSKSLSRNYPVGTRFRIRAKLTDREGGGQYLYSSWQWAFDVISTPTGGGR
jgi:hypothetical protein